MENHLYILYFCVILLTGYIIYIRKYLLKVVVILDTQKRFYMKKETQTFYDEDSSTEFVSDVPETYVNLHQYNKEICATSTPEERCPQRKRRSHRSKKTWQIEKYYQ